MRDDEKTLPYNQSHKLDDSGQKDVIHSGVNILSMPRFILSDEKQSSEYKILNESSNVKLKIK